MIRDILVKVAADVSDFTKKVTGASKTANDFGRDMAKASAVVTSAVKGVNDAAGTTSDAMKDLGDTVGDTTKSFEEVTKSHKEMMRNFRNTPEYKEYRAMNNELKMMRMQMELVNMRGMLPFQKQMIGVEKQIFGLAQSMGSYTKSNRDFMDEVTALGAAHKKATDQMINNDRMLGASIIRQAGYFRNMTTQAQRITETYDRMGNALYSVNKPGLSVANTLNKIANNGQASVVALRMLGPNASMKQLRDMTMQINQGLMRFQQVALAAAVAGGVLYYALARAAHGPDPSKVYEQQAEALAEYAKAVEDRTNEIVNTWDTFADIQLERTDVAQLTKNLEEQVDTLRDWRKNLASIAERAGDDFATNLSEMGPDAAKHIAEIAEMSDPELDNYVKLFNEKFKLAREQAETELEAMKKATDKKIKELADTLTPLGLAWAEFKGVWAEALQPMVESFGMVATAVVKAATAVGELIVAFNNANPVLGQLIQSVVMLVPILTLLLSPLAIGIGLINGYSAAFGFLWMIIGPLVTGLAAMSATVWLVAAAIVAVTALGIYLYRNWEQVSTTAVDLANNIATLGKILWDLVTRGGQANELFSQLPASWQNAFTNAGAALASFASMVASKVTEVATALFNMLPPGVQEAIRSGVEAISGFLSQLMTVFNEVIAGDFSRLGQLVANLIPTIVGALIGGLPGLLIAGARFLPAISEGITSNIGIISEKANEIITALLTGITTYLPIILQAGVQLIQTILNGIVTALPLVIEAITTLITFILTTLAENLPMILEAGVTILTTLLQGLVSALPVIIEVITSLISTITTVIAALLPLIIQAGIELLVALINGIVQALPLIIETIVSLITTLITTIVELLPIIIEAGIQIVTGLIQGIVEALPQIIDAVILLVTSLLDVIVQNLPLIIDAGVQVLLSLVQGIIDALPQLIDAALLLIISIVGALIENLPKILEAGVQLLLALIEGIIQIIPQLIEAIIEIVGVIIDTLIEHVPELLEMGVELMDALIDGIFEMIGDIGQAALDIGGELLDGLGSIIGDMIDIGADIINGLIEGIQSIDLGSVVAGLAKKIPDWVAKPLGIRSPSRVMRDAVGQWIPAGIGVGIDNGTSSVMRAAQRMAEDITRAATPSMPSIASPDVRGFERSINGQMRMSAAQISGNMAFEGSAPVVNVDVRNDWDGNQVRTKVNTDNAWDRRKQQRYL